MGKSEGMGWEEEGGGYSRMTDVEMEICLHCINY